MRTHAGPASGQRLEGWKAIARYLGKDPRTALRWVGLGLPVRRVNGRNSSVYAYAEELEEWLRRGPASPEPTETALLRALNTLARAEPAAIERVRRALEGLDARVPLRRRNPRDPAAV